MDIGGATLHHATMPHMTIEYRIIHLDISGPCSPLYGLCAVTLDAAGKAAAWSAAGIKPRGASTSGLVHQMHHMRAALDRPILKESRLNELGVAMVQKR